MNVEGTLGSRIRAARGAAGVSLRALSATLGVSPATLSQIENNRTNVTVHRLKAIADALGMSAGDLLEGAAPPLPMPTTTPAVRSRDQLDWRSYGPPDFDSILRAAVEEFVDVGYHGTSMRKISARCGISVPGIYGHYRSKQDILLQVLSKTLSDLEWRTDAAEAAGSDPVDKFCLVVENLALFHMHRRELGFIGTSDTRSLTPANRTMIAARRSHQQAVIDGLAVAAIRSGDFHVANPGDAGRVVVTMCTSLPTWWLPDGRLSPAEVADEYVGYALRLMGARFPVVE